MNPKDTKCGNNKDDNKIFDIDNVSTDVYTLTTIETIAETVHKNIKKYDTDDTVTLEIVTEIISGYRDLEYHGKHHSFMVFQFGYLSLENMSTTCSIGIGNDIKLLFLLVCLSHDLNHNGLTNRSIIVAQDKGFSNDSVREVLDVDKENMNEKIWGKSHMEYYHYVKIVQLVKKYPNVAKLFKRYDHMVIELLRATDLSNHSTIVDTTENISTATTTRLLQLMIMFADTAHCIRSEFYKSELVKRLITEAKVLKPIDTKLYNHHVECLNDQKGFVSRFVQTLYKKLIPVIDVNKLINRELMASTVNNRKRKHLDL